jgi:hypothetical protein
MSEKAMPRVSSSLSVGFEARPMQKLWRIAHMLFVVSLSDLTDVPLLESIVDRLDELDWV